MPVTRSRISAAASCTSPCSSCYVGPQVDSPQNCIPLWSIYLRPEQQYWDGGGYSSCQTPPCKGRPPCCLVPPSLLPLPLRRHRPSLQRQNSVTCTAKGASCYRPCALHRLIYFSQHLSWRFETHTFEAKQADGLALPWVTCCDSCLPYPVGVPTLNPLTWTTASAAQREASPRLTTITLKDVSSHRAVKFKISVS